MCAAGVPFSSLTEMFSRLRIGTVSVLLCWFALAAADSLAQAKVTTGLEGEIRIGPAGGPLRLGVPNTRPLINTVFLVKHEEKIIASFQTDSEGRFRLSLPPGKYTVSKPSGKVKVGSYGPFEVEIVAGQIKKVRWECDSGMQ